MTVEAMLEEIRTLSITERKRLIGLIVDTLTEVDTESNPPKHSLRELRGLGKEIWQGIDAQAYIDQQRDEWDSQ